MWPLPDVSALILALNPAVDAEWRVERVEWEEKNTILSERRWAGGKGVNVARWLHHLGGKPRLLLPLGGQPGAELARWLRAEKLPAKIIPLREPTRVDVIVTTAGSRQLRFNPPGPRLSRGEWNGILRAAEQNLASARLLVLSGSLPRGLPVTAYAKLIRLAHRFDVKTLLDCDGPAFAAAIKARPFLVKPNEHELGQWWRKPLRSEAELVCAARALSEQTRGWVLVSRGAKHGLLVNCVERFQCFALPPRVKPRNTVGAGDALLAAVAQQVERGAQPKEWLCWSTAVGTAATQYPPGQLPALSQITTNSGQV